MRNVWRGTAICAVFALVFGLTIGTALAQDAKIFEGTLVSADSTARVLVLKAGDKEMQFTYTDQTQLIGPSKDGQPVAVRQGSKLRVHYQESNNANVATQIEITEP